MNRSQKPPGNQETGQQRPESDSLLFSAANNPFLASWQAWLQQNSVLGGNAPSAESSRGEAQSTTATGPQDFSGFSASQGQIPSFWPFWANPWLNASVGSSPWGAPSINPLSPPDPAAMLRAFEPEEIEKKIQELNVITQWLTQILQSTKWTVQWLTWQKEAMNQLKATAAGSNPPPTNPKG